MSKMNFSLTENHDSSCWNKFKSFFTNNSEDNSDEIVIESAKYQRRKTLAFSIGMDDYPTPLTSTADDSSGVEKQFESRKSILKAKVF